MTHDQKVELAYLLDIVKEASKFKIEDGQDAIRLEVESRIDSILNSDDEEPEQESDDEPEPPPADSKLEKKRAQLRKAKNKYKLSNVRVVLDGKPVWKPRAECHQEKRFPDLPDSTAFKWVWDGPAEN